MRGKRRRRTKWLNTNRITPADAGKTACFLILFKFVKDHPRGCGENFALVSVNKRIEGSPPRMRGKLIMFFSTIMS